MIRLIASDLDGTLIREVGSHDREAIALLKDYAAQGTVFAAASGRCGASCRCLFEDWGLAIPWCIGVNGAYLQNLETMELSHVHELPQDVARKMADIMLAENLHICVYTPDSIAYSWEHAIEVSRERDLFPRMARYGVRTAAGAEAIEQAFSGRVLKVFAEHGEDMAAFERARAACAAFPGVTVTSSWHNNFEVMPEGVNKGRALRDLMTLLGAARAETVAFGDGENDTDMLRAAGTGVAMADGTAAAIAAADETAPSVAAWLAANKPAQAG